jgi:DNA modification methylase
MTEYQDFLQAKIIQAPRMGFDVSPEQVNPAMRPHCRAIVPWLLAGGRRALFSAFGLHKTVMQLEAVRLAAEHVGGRGLIVVPLGVRQEFMRDAVERLGWPEPPKFIRRIEEAGPTGVYLTNYETVRDGKLDPRLFEAASLDEASVLRGFGGTKTFREFMALFAGDDRRDKSQRIVSEGIRFRFVATATPSPNDYIELLAYAAFLGIMDVPAAKTRFFKRNSEKADQLTLLPHKEEEFWLWVASWAIFLQKPSDLGPEYSDEGYKLPPLDIRWHEIPSDHSAAGTEKDGQGRLFANAAISVQDAAREKRESLPSRVAKLLELREESPEAHRIIWHDLEAERHAIEKAIPSAVSVYGSQDLDEREASVRAFSDGQIAELAAKPVMLGSGCNLQRHCSWAIFLGIGHKFYDLIQAIHRVQRFGQTKPVRIDLIYTEAEREIRSNLERKWRQHEEMVTKMAELIRDFGLAHADAAGRLARSMGVERIEASGDLYRCINNDCVKETAQMADNSVDLIVTSIPFSTQYEYSPNYADFGHTDDNAHFWKQMDYLIPNLLRVLRPGRIAAIHVKDRIQPGGINGFGFQTVEPFSDECVAAFKKHGFAFLARKTIVTDVVRENNQTYRLGYRLGWTEQCKDGSRMGAGMPEYMLIFRKAPSDRSNGYGDVPVVKDKGAFTRPRWQFDAHGFARSSGNRPLRPDELEGLDQSAIFQLFKKHSLSNVYDFRHDVKIAEEVDRSGWLPTTFMLLQPQSWHPDVWTDITRMRTMNTLQAAKGRDRHICPLQFDIVDRCIEQYSMEGETVLDPFGGLMTVPYCAIKLKRRGIGIELNPAYYLDGCAYCAAAERDMSMPSLFDVLEHDREAA